MATEKQTFCRICDPHCPIIATVDDEGVLQSLRPNKNHPVSQGFACHKGLSFGQVNSDPDRLNFPMRRRSDKSVVPGDFDRISWDAAIDEIAAKLMQLQQTYGPDSVAVYMGNPIAFNSRAFPLAMSLAQALGSRYSFSANTQDLANKFSASQYVFGSHEFLVPDMLHTDFLISIGCNPKISRGTIVSTHFPAEVIKDIGARGGRVLFINPRKVESGGRDSGEVMQIKPDTDVYLMAALLHELDQLNGFDQQAIAGYAKHMDGLREFVAAYPAERVAEVVGIAADDIRQLARDIAAAPSVAFHMGTGPNQGRQGTLVYWLLNMLIFLTGNLGKPGGCYRPTGVSFAASDTVEPNPPMETPLGTVQPIWNDLPAALLPDLILHPSKPIRALINLSGNPLLSIPGETRMREALETLECLVSVDIYPSDTVEISDYVLPAQDWLEREDVTFSCVGFQLKPYVQYGEQAVKPAGERRNDWWILSRLLQAMQRPSMLDNPDSEGWDIVNMLFQSTPVSELQQAPHKTIELPPVADKRDAYQKVVLHKDGKIDCCPAVFADGLQRCEQIFAELESEPEGTLKLIGLRTNYMHNSWLSNMPQMRKGRHALNPLHIHPDDAAAKGLADGQPVVVFNVNGEVQTQLCFNPDLRPGTVAMSHGYGQHKAPRLTLAASIPGANVNRLLPIGEGAYEALSGMSWMNGVTVQIRQEAVTA